MKLLVWGANPAKIFPGEDCIPSPKEVELGDEGDEVLWVGWASAIGRKADGSLFALSPDGPQPLTDGQYVARKIIGGDNDLAYLDTAGYIRTLPRLSPGYDAITSAAPTATSSISRWADVAASETAILGLTPNGQLLKFHSINGILSFDTDSTASALQELGDQVEANSEERPEHIALPPLPASTFRLYALETRLFVHIAGAGMQQLLELVQGDDDLGLGQSSGAGVSGVKRTYMASAGTGSGDGAGDAGVVVKRTRLVNIDIDALGFTIVPGPKNRLGILTDTGEAYLLDSRTREPELLRPERGDQKACLAVDTGPSAGRERQGEEDEAKEEDEDPGPEVRLLGIESGFEVLVRSDGVWVRGERAFGQLGDGTTSDMPSEHFHRLSIDAERITAVLCSRWTTVLSIT